MNHATRRLLALPYACYYGLAMDQSTMLSWTELSGYRPVIYLKYSECTSYEQDVNSPDTLDLP